MRSCYTFLPHVLIVLLILLVFGESSDVSFAVIGDPHVGPGDHTEKYDATVTKINSIVNYFSLDFVLVVGDITGSARGNQYRSLKVSSDILDIPYYQVLGNHDIGSFDGDETFYTEFGSQLESDEHVTHYTGSQRVIYNSLGNLTRFHNYELKFHGNIFFVVDFVNRKSNNYDDVMSKPNFWNITNGTWEWLNDRLSSHSENNFEEVNQLFFVSHYPFQVRTVPPTPEEATPTRGSDHVMSSEQVSTFLGLLEKYNVPASKLWGSVAGHMHVENYVKMFPGDSTYGDTRDYAALGNLNDMGIGIVQVKNGVAQDLVVVDSDWTIPQDQDNDQNGTWSTKCFLPLAIILFLFVLLL